MPGYHFVSTYDVTMGTKRQSGAWGLSCEACARRLQAFVLLVVFLKTTPPCPHLDKRLGVEKEMLAKVFWLQLCTGEALGLCLFGNGGSQ